MMFGSLPSAATRLRPQDFANAVPQQPAKPKFFGQGGTGRNIAGMIGDVLLQQSGMRPIFTPAMQQRQAMQFEEGQYQRRRQDGFEDWKAKEAWERQNPAPRQPYRWESNDGSLMEIGADGQPRAVYKDPTPKLSWIQVDTPQGKMIVPVGPQGPMMNGGATQQGSDDEWDYEPAPAQGGPSPRGSGGFR